MNRLMKTRMRPIQKSFPAMRRVPHSDRFTMTQDQQKKPWMTVLILGLMTSVSPFSIDMYLPAFPKIATALNTTVPEVALTLTTYFGGLAGGQLIYGPLMDRFGRKYPLYVGLSVYIVASLLCAMSSSIQDLLIYRCLQALGGCSAGVAAFAMVRDLFSPKESAKVLSTLVLILGASPLLAPTAGSLLAVYAGWPWLFYSLAIGVTLLLVLIIFRLPETRGPDTSQKLNPLAIVRSYGVILRNPNFLVYGLAGAIGFAGLFVYLASSPTIFMEIFKATEKTYGIIFATIAAGFVLTSQTNVLLLRKFSNQTILIGATSVFTLVSLIFVIAAHFDLVSMPLVILLLFLILSTVGLSSPNGSALTMAPFGSNAGSAAALLGFLQMSVGALSAYLVGFVKFDSLVPISYVFLGSASLSLAILLTGQRLLKRKSDTSI